MKSASTSLAIFFASTMVYFIAKHLLIDKSMDDMSSMSTILTLGYLVIIIGSQIGINISNTAQLCNGTPQVVPAIMYTILPIF